MAELDQHRPTTSSYHRPSMEEAVVKMKRMQRFTRQFSIFVHSEEDDPTKIISPSKLSKSAPAKQDENSDDRLFKYPGNLRAIKRKRNVSNQCPQNTSAAVQFSAKTVAKRRMMEHQKSICDRDIDRCLENGKNDNKPDHDNATETREA